MRTKVLIALLLIVLLPVAALGWFGLRLLQSERQALEHRVQALIDAQLTAVDDTLAAYFAARRSEFLADAQKLALETDALRNYVRGTGIVRQMFVMDAKGERVHPPRNAPLTESEQRFLVRSAEIWRSREILYQGGSEAAAPQPLTKKSSASARINTKKASGEPGSHNDGWYVWHWGAETDLIFWRKTDRGELIGFELEPARVKAELIGVLPTSDSAEDRPSESRIQLIDARGGITYQWGDYEPKSTKPLALRPLSHPLDSWKLAYHAPPVVGNDTSRSLLLGGVLGSLALALGGLAFYLYREHTREARLAAQRVNFVNQVSHELKTPLTNIRMYAELLADQIDETEDKPRRYIDIIVGESQRLSRLILNVLNFGRLQREPLKLRREPGSIDDVVRSTLENFRPALEAKNITIQVRANAPGTVSLDKDAVEQILNNLLSNVEKYASGEQLILTTKQDTQHSVIRVHDHGAGIPKHERERIFQPFYRLTSKLSDGVTGTGIGLTIARELARLHGGDLKLVDSETGACFEVTLRTEEPSA